MTWKDFNWLAWTCLIFGWTFLLFGQPEWGLSFLVASGFCFFVAILMKYTGGDGPGPLRPA